MRAGLRTGLLGLGVLALAGAVAVAVWRPELFFAAWLEASLIVLGLSLGAIVWRLVHGLTGGHWGELLGPSLRALALGLPFALLLFAPLLAGVELLFPWTGAHENHRPEYLNTAGLVVRTLVVFAIWLALAWAASRPRVGTGTAAPGLILYLLSVSLFAVDWLMSLEAPWYSTTFGFLIATGQAANALAVAILLPHADPVPPERLQDVGNLLMAAIMLWAYIAFTQYLIIWSGDLPEEISWYLHRSSPGWIVLAAATFALHFALPFVLLLFQRIKRDPRTLRLAAGAVLLGRLLEAHWLVAPAFPHQQPALHAMAALAMLAVGALMAYAILRLAGSTAQATELETSRGGAG